MTTGVKAKTTKKMKNGRINKYGLTFFQNLYGNYVIFP